MSSVRLSAVLIGAVTRQDRGSIVGWLIAVFVLHLFGEFAGAMSALESAQIAIGQVDDFDARETHLETAL